MVEKQINYMNHPLVGKAMEQGVIPSRAIYILKQGLNPTLSPRDLSTIFHRWVSLAEGSGVYESIGVSMTQDVINGADPNELNRKAYILERSLTRQENIKKFGFDPDPHRLNVAIDMW